MGDKSSKQLIMEEPWGPNRPQEFDDYEESQSQVEEEVSGPCSYDGSVELVDFGYDRTETRYPLEENSAERASLIGSFQTVFTDQNSPYDENWGFETTNDFLESTSELDYEGILAVEEGRVAGFAWGYRVDKDSADVEEKYPEVIDDVVPEIYDGETFMIDEVGVMPDYRDQGLGTALESCLLSKLSEKEDISRSMQRTQWSGQNMPKLELDKNMGFDVLTFQDGRADKPVLQEVEFVGKEGSDERAYLFQELEGEKPWK
jgi:GNAT superfamily N-acetyltransferase